MPPPCAIMPSRGMRECELSIQVDEPFGGRLDQAWLRRVVEETLATAGVSAPVELGLVVTDAETVRRLNRSYRGRDEATDVLSFALLEDHEASFVAPPDGVLHLGEVLLSYPQAEAQAREQGHTVEWEVALLVVHGVLHLLGYGHEDDEGEARMQATSDLVLARVAAEKR